MPDRVTLAGFNGLDIVKSLPVPIVTSWNPRREIGKTATEFTLSANKSNEKHGTHFVEYTPRIELGT